MAGRDRGPAGLHVSAWNLLLLVPLLMLVTPWYNKAEPALFGMPFFYWFQFLWVPVGVLCVLAVHRFTPSGGTPSRDADEWVDDLDEGDRR